MKLIEKNFSIKIKDLRQIKTNAFFVKTKSEYDYFLKWSRVDKAHVDFIIEIYTHLKSTNFKSHLIDFEKTRDGGFYFLDQEGKIYLLCKWVEGRSADYKSTKDIERAIVLLDQLHQCTIDFKVKDYDKVLLPYEDIFKNKYSQIKLIKNIIHQKNKAAKAEPFDRYYLNAITKFEDRFVECIAMMKKIGKEFRKTNPCVLIHHDPAHHNFLITNDNIYLIDFDYAVTDYDVHDFSNLAVRILKTNEWDVNKFRLYLKLLISKNIPRRFWFEVFWLLMRFPQELWQVGIQYYFEKQPWRKEYFIKRLMGAVEIQTKKEMVLNKLIGGKGICL